MSLTTSQEIDEAARFPTARRGGYSEADVDAFVRLARDTILSLSERLAVCESARSELESRLAAQVNGSGGTRAEEETPSRALRLLEMAQASADAAVADAEECAAQLLHDAEERAAVREAEARAAAEAAESASHREQDRLRQQTAGLQEGVRTARDQARGLAERLVHLVDRAEADADQPEPVAGPVARAAQGPPEDGRS